MEYYFDKRFEKTFKVIDQLFTDKNGIEKMKIQYKGDPEKTINRNEFDYYVANGIWSKWEHQCRTFNDF